MEKQRNNFKDTLLNVAKFFGMILLSLTLILLTIYLTYRFFTCTTAKDPILADKIASSGALQKSDWLAFWGSILAVFCTLSLALVSYSQNKVLRKTNFDREKKDTYFAKLRFAAEFYSLIEFESLFIRFSLNKTVHISMKLLDVGKIPPTTIDITQFIVKPKDENYVGMKFKLNPIMGRLLHQKKVEIKNSKDQESKEYKNRERTIDFQLDYEEFKEFINLYNNVIEHSKSHGEILRTNEPLLILSMKYTLDNPLEVQTKVVSNLILKNTFGGFSNEDEPIAYEFKIMDAAASKIKYDFTGEMP